MKKILITAIWSLCHFISSWGQGEETLWAFGTHGGLDFSATSPIPYNTNIFPGYEGSAGVCNSSGNLLFYTNGFWVWNIDHEIMPELTGGVGGYTAPIAPSVGYPPMMPWTGAYATQATAIARMPADTGKYYLFSLSSAGQLYYSVIDMNLNAGKGGVVSGKKGVFLSTGLTEKLTVVKGCNSIWVMVRSKTANQYKAYEINDTGIVTTPVISECGNLPVSWYRYGVIKFSVDGTKMAAACNKAWNGTGGLELYEFDVNTGILSNAVVLDSSSSTGYYYGACFSPDDSKLYASTSSFTYQGSYYAGKVRQFDLSLGSSAAIIASNTVVFTDYYTDDDRLGDLKRGKNSKIYFSSGKSSSFIHAINLPNVAGTGCNAVANVITLPSSSAERGMPNDVAVLPVPDNIHSTRYIGVCFRDSVQIVADTGKQYLWENGSRERSRTLTNSGIYIVRYINTDCRHQTDTFNMHFIKVPALSFTVYGCPKSKQAKALLLPASGDTTTFVYTWRDDAGNVLRQSWSQYGDSLMNADTGLYHVQVSTPGGCDTTLDFTIIPLPLPEVSFTGDSLVCVNEPVQFINHSTAPLWKWYFGDGNISDELHPLYSYSYTGSYTVALVATNIEGCSDTAYQDIEVKSLDLHLSADKSVVNRGEQINLSASADVPFTVTAWEPGFLFPDQSAFHQSLYADTTRTYIVTGISTDGCEAKASVEVAVNPTVLMPNAFSPNRDGLNDRFKPFSTGYITVRLFEVFNRFGERVYGAYGSDALKGWDGTYKGRPCDLGTYFYHINLETETGQNLYLKGDVVLLR